MKRSLVQLRPYQQEAIKGLWKVWREKPFSKPLIIAPTGSGKSLLIAEICRAAIAKRPDFRIIVLAHRKELIQQNASQIFKLTEEPVGIYANSFGLKQIKRITVAQIQSIFRVQDLKTDLIIIDEVHLFSGKDDSMYGKFLANFRDAKVVGMTATPMRMDQGSILGGTFNELACNIELLKLIEEGYLSPVISKPTMTVDMTGVARSGNDYNIGQMEQRFSPLVVNHVKQIQELAADRIHVLVFGVDIDHCEKVTKALGYEARLVTGKTLPFERDSLVSAFKEGKFKYLVNCEILTTGFDFPALDCIVLLRATRSTSLYIQIIGRGMRTAEGKKDCLVLDFGGNIERFGPVDCIEIKRKGEKLDIGCAPVRYCPTCGVVSHARALECICGYVFPPLKPPEAKLDKKASELALLSNQIKPEDPTSHLVLGIETGIGQSNKAGSKPYFKIVVKIGGKWVLECLCFDHFGRAAHEAQKKWKMYGGNLPSPRSVKEAHDRRFEIKQLNKATIMKDGEYYRVLSVEFLTEQELKKEVEESLKNNPFNI